MTTRLTHLMAGGALTLFVLAAGCGTSGESGSMASSGVSAKSSATASFTGTTETLPSGWNAIGLRGLPVTSIQGTNIAGFAYWDGTAYQTKSLTLEEVNANGGTRRGLWVFATGTGNITYSATDPSAVSLDLRAGWNLVAFPNTTPLQGHNFIARTGPNTTVPLGQVLLPQFNEIQPDRTYRQVDVTTGGSVLPGKAYWVFASQSVALSYGATPTASPSPASSPVASPSPGVVPVASPSPGSSPTPAVSPSPATSPAASPSPAGTLTSTFFPVTGALSEVHAISDDGRWVFGNQFDFGSNLYFPFDADLVNGVLTRDQSAFATNFGDRYFSGGSATADGSIAFIASANRDELARHTRSTNSGQGLGAYGSFADDPYTNASGSMVAYNTVFSSSSHACIWRASSGHALIEDLVGGVGRIISCTGRQPLSDNSQLLVQDRPSSGSSGTQYLRVNLENNQVTTVFAPNTSVSSDMWLSGDGTQVLYFSGPDEATGEMFVHDVDGGTPTDDRVGVSNGGAIANAPCYTSRGIGTPFSSSGRFVVFYSEANNLVTGDSGNTGDYFLRDRLNRTTVRVNVDETGARLDGLVFPAMSRNAQWIVWPASGGYRRVRNPAL